MHSGGHTNSTKLTYSRHEDNLLLRAGDRIVICESMNTVAAMIVVVTNETI